MADGLYRIKDLAQELGIGESTVRFWRDRYYEWLPAVGQGKRRRYKAEALDVLRLIQQKTNRNESQQEIEDALTREFARNIEPQQQPQRSSAATQQQVHGNENLASIREFVHEVFEGVQGIIQEQNRRMEALETENRELRERLTRLEERDQQRITAPQQQTATGLSREQIIDYLIELYQQGMSYRAIATRLNSEGIKGLRSGTWDGTTVRRLIRKAGYS